MKIVSNLNDQVQYISNLKLKLPRAEYALTNRGGATAIALQEGKDQSFFNDKSLISFVTNVTAQNREDVLQSTLLAQLAANKKYPVEEDILKWYMEFSTVLANLGWFVEGKDLTSFKTTEQGVELQNVIIDLLSSAFGANWVTVIKNTLGAINKLSDADNQIVAFEKNIQTLEKGCFQIGLAVSDNDAVSLQLGTFLITGNHKIKKILFVKIQGEETKIEYVSKKASFSPTAYGNIREAVSRKIKDYMNEYVAEIALSS